MQRGAHCRTSSVLPGPGPGPGPVAIVADAPRTRAAIVNRRPPVRGVVVANVAATVVFDVYAVVESSAIAFAATAAAAAAATAGAGLGSIFCVRNYAILVCRVRGMLLAAVKWTDSNRTWLA